MPAGRAFVLVHGVFHGPWVWQPVAAQLEAAGFHVVTVDLPSGLGVAAGLSDDAQAVRSQLGEIGEEVVLVGHSYGGMVAVEAAAGRSSTEFVFISALISQVGRSATDLILDVPSRGYLGAVRRVSEGALEFDQSSAPAVFYSEAEANLALWAARQLRSQSIASVYERAAATLEGRARSTYVVCTRDRALDLRLQERVSSQAADVRRWGSDHVPMLSQPRRTARLLMDIATRPRTHRSPVEDDLH